MNRTRGARSRLLLALAGLATAFALAACGGGDSSDSGDSDDEAAISEVIVAAVTQNDAEAFCEEYLSENFVKAVFTDVETCVKASEDGATAEDATVTDIAVDGDTATATITEVGGDTADATGTISLVKVDGDWRVDELGVDYLRSMMEQGLAVMADSDDSPQENPLVDADVRKCFGDALDELSDEQFRQFAYDGMAGRENEDLIAAITACLQQ